jgi:MFS family permease
MQQLAGSRTVLVLVAVTFLLLLGASISEPIRPLFIVGVGASTLELGLVMALQSLVSVATRIPASALSGRLGRRRLVAFSIALSVATTVMFAFVYSPIVFYPLVSLSALSWSVFSPISLVVVSDHSGPSTRGAVMGIYFSAIGAAMFFGPLLCSFLTLFIGFRELFIVSACFPLIALVLFVLKTSRSEMDEVAPSSNPGEERGGGTLESLARIFRVRNVAAVCYAQVAFALSYGVFSTLFAIYAEGTLGLAAPVIALLFSFRALNNVLTRLPAGRMSDRIGRRRPVILSHAIVVAVFVVLPFVKDPALLALLLAVYGVGWGMRVAPDSALVSESVPPEDRPLALALLMTMFDVGFTLGSLFAGATTAFLSIPIMFLLCAPILLSGLISLVFLTTETLTR